MLLTPAKIKLFTSSNSDIAAEFWQTMCGGVLPLSPTSRVAFRFVNETDVSWSQLWQKLFESGYMQEFVNEEALMFDDAFRAVSVERAFFITEKGCVGRAPWRCREGD